MTNRHGHEHRSGSCNCESKNIDFASSERLEPSIEDRETVLGIFSRHFNCQTLIPDRNGTYRSPEVIYRECAMEIYSWCRSRNYFRLWAYLYLNWYRSGRWELWARSHDPIKIPVLKTTMIVESPWRRIKHDFLYRYNRPCIYQVIWIFTIRLIPRGINRMNAIQCGDARLRTVSWRKDFKHQRRQYQSQGASLQIIRRHHTNAASWTCGCEKFLLSRFLLCQHIINCYERIDDYGSFFSNIQRQRSSPFWVEPRLVLPPEFQVTTNQTPSVLVEELELESSSILQGEGQGRETRFSKMHTPFYVCYRMSSIFFRLSCYKGSQRLKSYTHSESQWWNFKRELYTTQQETHTS